MVMEIKQITYSEYLEAVKGMSPEQRALSPYFRRVKFRDTFQDEKLEYEEFISILEKRFNNFEKEVSDPNDFDYYVNETKRLWYIKNQEQRYRNHCIIIPYTDFEEYALRFPTLRQRLEQYKKK